jgi:hypothetical protein
MWIYLGGDFTINDRNILGVFDIENTSISQLTKDFLKHSEKEKNICYVSMNMPKSFVVCKCNRKKHNSNIVYVCAVSPQTLKKRARNSEIPD